MSAPLTPEKEALRRAILAWRRGMDPVEKAGKDAAIRAHLLALPELAVPGTLFSYASTRDEVDTRTVMKVLLERGWRIALPRCVTGTRDMECYQVADLDKLRPGAYGIPEPPGDRSTSGTADCLMLVPALAVDVDGFRLGYGGGYYDRYLTRFPGRTVCLCYEAQYLPSLPREATDLPCDLVITERGIRVRRASP